MTADQIEKLKALALAAEKGGQHIYTNPRDSNKWKDNEAWQQAASPEAFSELIAEVERLRAEKRPKDHNIRQLVNDLRDIALKFHAAGQLRARISGAVGQFIDNNYSVAAGAARQGGGTSENGWASGRAETGIKTAETRMDAAFSGGPSGSAPAAGTEKDALLEIADTERKRIAAEYQRRLDEGTCEVGGHVNRQWAHLEGAVKVVQAIRAAIGAYTKAGTEPTAVQLQALGQHQEKP